WYRERGVPARYIGHPYFDELRGQRLDGAFVAAQRARPGTVVGLLPGSRNQELHYNLDSLYRAAALVHRRRPAVPRLAASPKPAPARRARASLRAPGLPIEVHAGWTPEVIPLAHSCISVSGSVSLELLYRARPSVVVYRHNWLGIFLAGFLKRVP